VVGMVGLRRDERVDVEQRRRQFGFGGGGNRGGVGGRQRRRRRDHTVHTALKLRKSSLRALLHAVEGAQLQLQSAHLG